MRVSVRAEHKRSTRQAPAPSPSLRSLTKLLKALAGNRKLDVKRYLSKAHTGLHIRVVGHIAIDFSASGREPIL